MKQKFIFTGITCFVFLFCFSQQASEQFLIGKYFGRTPCQELAKQLQHATTAECIKIKWSLELYGIKGDIHSGKFILEGLGYRGQNALEGQWNILRGTVADPGAIVYELVIPGKGNLLLQKLDDVLFFLDEQKNLLVGNYDFSYALNREVR